MESLTRHIQSTENHRLKRGVKKVIIETGLLTEAEKIEACRIVQPAADFVKTYTGFLGSVGNQSRCSIENLSTLICEERPAVVSRLWKQHSP